MASFIHLFFIIERQYEISKENSRKTSSNITNIKKISGQLNAMILILSCTQRFFPSSLRFHCNFCRHSWPCHLLCVSLHQSE